MSDKKKLFQECMNRGKDYFFNHKNVRPKFISFHQAMLPYFGEENSNLIESAYYKLITYLPATKIFGFDSEQFKDLLNNLTDIKETKKSYDHEKNKAEELLKALNSYRSEYYYKTEELYRGRADDERLVKGGYLKKDSRGVDTHNEERLKYYTEGIADNLLIKIFSYEFMSNYSDIGVSEISYVKRIMEKIEEELIIFLGDITRFYHNKLAPKPIEVTPELTETTPEPAEVKTEPAELTPRLTGVTPARKSTSDKISIIEEQIDIVRIIEAMYSSGIILAKTEIKQIAQLFFNNTEDIDKFVINYSRLKKMIIDKNPRSNSKKFTHFIKLLLNGLKKFGIKDIVEHLRTIHSNK